MFAQAASGAALGAVLGGVAGLALAAMAERKRAADTVRGRTAHLAGDPQVAELISRFEPLSVLGDEPRRLYDTLVQSADRMVQLCAPAGGAEQPQGTRPIRANRLLHASCDAAARLCRLAHDEHRHEAAPALLQDVEALRALLTEHLHNLMLG